MSMTRQEAIKALEQADNYVGIHYINGVEDPYISPYLKEAINIALTVLRPVSREQVEKVWRGEWDYPTCEWNLPKCPKCGCNSKDAMYGHKNNFCPRCGEAMTGEAVDMVMERINEMEETTDEH